MKTGRALLSGMDMTGWPGQSIHCWGIQLGFIRCQRFLYRRSFAIIAWHVRKSRERSGCHLRASAHSSIVVDGILSVDNVPVPSVRWLEWAGLRLTDWPLATFSIRFRSALFSGSHAYASALSARGALDQRFPLHIETANRYPYPCPP